MWENNQYDIYRRLIKTFVCQKFFFLVFVIDIYRRICAYVIILWARLQYNKTNPMTTLSDVCILLTASCKDVYYYYEICDIKEDKRLYTCTHPQNWGVKTFLFSSFLFFFHFILFKRQRNRKWWWNGREWRNVTKRIFSDRKVTDGAWSLCKCVCRKCAKRKCAYWSDLIIFCVFWIFMFYLLIENVL